MFEFSIWKLMIIGGVALVVIGPDRLPEVARTAGRWFGRLQRYVATVKNDINREIEASEFNQVKNEFQSAARDIESNVNQTMQNAETQMQSVHQEITGSAVDINNTDLIANEVDETLSIAAPETDDSDTTISSLPPPTSNQGTLDFGNEDDHPSRTTV